MLNQEKIREIKNVIAAAEKQFGQGALMILGAMDQREVNVYPTGLEGLDLAIGTGGLPRGRLTEVFGPSGSGKTTLALSLIAKAQERGGVCTFIDTAHTLDITYAKELGVQLPELLIAQPENGEQALEIADTLVGTGAVDVIVFDSVETLLPQALLEGEISSQVTIQARLASQALRKLTAAAHRYGALILFLRQVPSSPAFSPVPPSGIGLALKFYTSIRIELQKEEDGFIKAKIVKNKVAPPFTSARFVLGKTERNLSNAT